MHAALGTLSPPSTGGSVSVGAGTGAGAAEPELVGALRAGSGLAVAVVVEVAVAVAVVVAVAVALGAAGVLGSGVLGRFAAGGVVAAGRAGVAAEEGSGAGSARSLSLFPKLQAKSTRTNPASSKRAMRPRMGKGRARGKSSDGRTEPSD